MLDGPANDEIMKIRATRVLGAACPDPYPPPRPEVSVETVNTSIISHPLPLIRSAAESTHQGRCPPIGWLCSAQSSQKPLQILLERRAACVGALHQLLMIQLVHLGAVKLDGYGLVTVPAYGLVQEGCYQGILCITLPLLILNRML